MLAFVLILSLVDLSIANELPTNYENLSGCDKQDQLWSRVLESEYKELPEFNNLGLFQFLAMSFQELKLKANYQSDVVPKGWKKYLHRFGAIAKVKIVPRGSEYTGIFAGADCAMLRLSLTYNPRRDDKPVAPGLALKVLRNGISSANVSALYALNGQENNYNFFAHPLSNIVPAGESIGERMIHRLFSRVSKYPEQLKVVDMATRDSLGKSAAKVVAPAQIFFVPNQELRFSSDEHDVREDFLDIPAGTTIYKLYALKQVPHNFDYEDYSQQEAQKFLAQSTHIADIVTTSKFISSSFGDEGIFFRHEIHPK